MAHETRFNGTAASRDGKAPRVPSTASGGLAVEVGETVVYAAHGVGRVVALEHRRVGGIERQCVVLELDTGLRVTLSLDEAASRLRSVAGGVELEGVSATLGAEASRRDRQWTRRMKENQDKLSRGRPVDLAEIVRDGACHEQLSKNGLSHGERRLYRQARDLLVREICSAREIETEEADAWIDSRIGASDRREP
jgi:CarD family transcriptional regulator, regulator of rRNA transcription